MLRNPLRRPFAFIFLACAGLLGFGLYLQYGYGLEPCPMCIMQRYAFVAVALAALGGALHAPRGVARHAYAGSLALISLLGGGIAAWQSWLQRFPPEMPECGPGLEYMLGSFPLTQALPMIFRGGGDCSVIEWAFLGLSIANWSLIAFLLVFSAAIAILIGKDSFRATMA